MLIYMSRKILIDPGSFLVVTCETVKSVVASKMVRRMIFSLDSVEILQVISTSISDLKPSLVTLFVGAVLDF